MVNGDSVIVISLCFQEDSTRWPLKLTHAPYHAQL